MNEPTTRKELNHQEKEIACGIWNFFSRIRPLEAPNNIARMQTNPPTVLICNVAFGKVNFIVNLLMSVDQNITRNILVEQRTHETPRPLVCNREPANVILNIKNCGNFWQRRCWQWDRFLGSFKQNYRQNQTLSQQRITHQKMEEPPVSFIISNIWKWGDPKIFACD